MELTIDRLTKQYKNKIAVDRLSFSLTKGVTGLLGANGAGKTTLLRILLGLEHPDSGTVTGLGNARVSAVFQEDRLLEHLTPWATSALPWGPAWTSKRPPPCWRVQPL